MSELNKLLEGAKVEWCKLWEVTIWDKRFNSVERSKQKQIASHQYMLAADLFKLEQPEGDVFLLSTGERTGWTTKERAGSYLRKGEIVSIPWGKSRPVIDVLKYYTGFYVTADNRIATSIDLKILSNKYLFYWLQTQTKLIDSFYRGSGIKHPSMSNVLDMDIPLPKIEIQEEIVRLLDKLTEETNALTNELDKELKARQKQYEYYREKLFSFDRQNTKHLPLGHESIGEFIRGSGLQKKDFTETGIGCIHYGQVYTYYSTVATETKSFVSEEFAKNARKAKTGDLVIATTSENDDDVCKAVAWLGISDIAVSSDACFYRHKLEPLYVAYYFQTEQFQSQKRKYITGIKVRRVNANDLAKIQVPVPSKEEQERIVKILGGLDTTTQAITSEIKKEITLRNKQYNYYRDLLLTFPMDID